MLMPEPDYILPDILDSLVRNDNPLYHPYRDKLEDMLIDSYTVLITGMTDEQIKSEAIEKGIV